MDFMQIIGFIVGGGGALAAAAFYLKFSATKGNIDGLNATVEIVSRQRDAANSENIELRAKVSELTGENRTLKSLATQTPEIIKLTESVTHLSDSMTVGNQQTTKMLSTTVKLLRVLTRQKGKSLDEEITE